MDLVTFLKIAKAALMLSSCFAWEDTGRDLLSLYGYTGEIAKAMFIPQ